MGFEIKPPKGATKTKVIAGRGKSSRRGGTAGSGNNGQNARSGGGVRTGFEGGQMPLYRRVAIKGFSNARFKTVYQTLNVSMLEKRFASGDEVTIDALKAKGLISGGNPVKILGNGELTIKLDVKIEKLSASAIEKIKKAGGTVVEQKTEEGING